MTAEPAVYWGAASRMNALRLSVFCALLSAALYLFAAPQSKPPAQPQRETIARPLSEKEKKRNEEKLKKELETPYRKWLSEDVAYIITQEEKDAFKRLQTDDEREQFIEQFWLRRDPTPDTVENEFKEEHYRRIAYTNEHFASGIPGWKTDRGRIYIEYGPPDDIEDHSSGGTYERPREEGGGSTSTYPFQQWRYRYIEGVGTGVMIEFVDTTMSGEFRMTMDPSEKDALLRSDLHVPVPTMALPVHRGRRDGRDDRIRRHHHVRRVPHDHGSFREGCPALHPGRRSHDVRANGHHEQDRPLPSHRRHAPRLSERRDDEKPEPIPPAGTVHQPAEAARREIQGSGGDRRHAYQL